jgi:hypothetical protein
VVTVGKLSSRNGIEDYFMIQHEQLRLVNWRLKILREAEGTTRQVAGVCRRGCPWAGASAEKPFTNGKIATPLIVKQAFNRTNVELK